MQEFILAETSEIIETLHPYGDVISDKWVYRIVATIDKDGDVFIRHQGASEIGEELGFEDFEAWQSIDFNKKDFNLDELKRFNEALIESVGV